MKKSFISKHISAFTILLVSAMAYSSNMATMYVYVCNGPSSKAYHYSPNCKGLQKCSKQVIKVTLEEAKEKGRKLCGYED